VTATIELLEKALHHIDQAHVARRGAAVLEREAVVFRDDVERLIEGHAPDLAGVPTDRAAAEIVDRYHRGKIQPAARSELDRQLQDAMRQLERKQLHLAASAHIAE
jgi:hypothetical protein